MVVFIVYNPCVIRNGRSDACIGRCMKGINTQTDYRKGRNV